MAELKTKADLSLKFHVTLKMSIIEAEALNEMTKYGIKSFLKGYKKMLGSHYIEPHEKGLAMLFETIDGSLPKELYKLNKLREAIAEAEKEFKEKHE